MPAVLTIRDGRVGGKILLLALLYRPQRYDSGRDLLCNADQRFDERAIYVQMPLVLSHVAFTMGVIEHAPLFRLQLECVLQALEYGVSMFRSIAVPTEGSEGKCVCRVVGEVEAAIQTQRFRQRVAQPRLSGSNQSIDF